MSHLHTYFMYLCIWSHVKVTWLARSLKWRKFRKPWCGAGKPKVQVSAGSCTLFLLFPGSQEPRPQPVHPGLSKRPPGGRGLTSSLLCQSHSLELALPTFLWPFVGVGKALCLAPPPHTAAESWGWNWTWSWAWLLSHSGTDLGNLG